MKLFSLELLLSCLAVAMGAVNLRANNPDSVVSGLKEKLDAFDPADVKLAALAISDKLLTSKVEGDAWLGLVEEIVEAESLDGFDLASHDVEAIAKAAETINTALKEHDQGRRLLPFGPIPNILAILAILNLLAFIFPIPNILAILAILNL